MTGMKHFWAVEDFFKGSPQAEYAFKDFCNLADGNLTVKLDLFKLPCGLVPFELILYYNSMADLTVPSSFGAGWQSIFDQRVEEVGSFC